MKIIDIKTGEIFNSAESFWEFYCGQHELCKSDKDMEADAIKTLTNSLERKFNALMQSESEKTACLRAIMKINQGQNKDIDALCE